MRSARAIGRRDVGRAEEVARTLARPVFLPEETRKDSHHRTRTPAETRCAVRTLERLRKAAKNSLRFCVGISACNPKTKGLQRLT
jgi:hypothetical protein